MNFQPRHFLAALALHAVLFAAIFVGAVFQKRVPPATVMEASLIEDPRIAQSKARELEELRKKAEEEQQKKLEEEKKKIEEEKKPTPEEVARQDEQKKKLREQAEVKKQEQLKLKADAERKRQEENKKKQEDERQKKEAEAEMKKALNEEMQRQLDEEKRVADELKRKREAEAKAIRDAILAAQRAEDDARLAGKNAQWSQLIAARIRKFWTRPPGSAARFNCLVRIEQRPGGEVVRATIVRSCGNPAIDRSVEAAALKASPLPPPPDPEMPFETVLQTTFCPGDASSCN